MKPTNNNNPATMTADELLHTGHAAAYIAIRRRAEYSDFLTRLQWQAGNDRKREHIADFGGEALALRQEHDTERAKAAAAQTEADQQTRIANSITATAATRQAARAAAAQKAAQAADYRRAAAEALAAAQDLEKLIADTTTSDREDIVQSAIAAYLEALQTINPAWVTARNLAKAALTIYKQRKAEFATNPNERTREALREAVQDAHAAKRMYEETPRYTGDIDWSEDNRNAAFTVAIKAAGKAISALAASKGHPHTSTKITAITPAQAAEWVNTYHTTRHGEPLTADTITPAHVAEPVKVPFAVRGGNTAGYTTVEHRNTKRHPDGFYSVKHYHGYSPRNLDECLNVAAPTPEEAAEAAERANLSERERAVIALMDERNTDPAAHAVQAAGVAAVAAHQAQTAVRVAAADTQRKRNRIQREADKQTDTIRAAAMMEAAWETVGVCDNVAQRKAKSRLKDKMQAAMNRKPQPLPEAVTTTAAPVIRITVSRTPDRRTDAQKAYAAWYRKQFANIKWLKHYPKPEPLTPAELEAMTATDNARKAAQEAAEQKRIAAAIAEAAAKHRGARHR